MDYDKLIHCLKCCARVDAQNVGCDDCGLEYCGEECQQLCGTAATAIETLLADLARVTAERDAAEALLAERSGVIGSAPITTAFGVPLDRLRKLVEADREQEFQRHLKRFDIMPPKKNALKAREQDGNNK